jgi:hypothetical protein
MTRPEFKGQFDRLCAGYRFDATAEQTEAWYRRVGHVAPPIWSETVTNLLCADRFPRDLDRVLLIIDQQLQAHRAKAIAHDKPLAARIERMIEEGKIGLDSVPFQVIKAYAGRRQVRVERAWYQKQTERDEMKPLKIERELLRLQAEEARLETVIREGIPKLSTEDAYRLMMQYEPATA